MRYFILFILSIIISMSVFAQNHVNPSYRQGVSFEVESGYADNGGYFDISSGCNIIHGLYVGLGGGYERHDFDGKLHTMVPAFIQARYSFLGCRFLVLFSPGRNGLRNGLRKRFPKRRLFSFS